MTSAGVSEPAAMHQDGCMTSTEANIPVIELVTPLAGFPRHRRFALVRLDEHGTISSLRSIEDPDLRFLVVPPGPFFPDYAPEVTQDWAERLELVSPEEALLLLIVTPGASAAEATANLLAPLVVNIRTRTAAQVLLDADLPLRAPLAA